MPAFASWARELDRIEDEFTLIESAATEEAADFSRYRLDPIGYARDVHGIICTPQQSEILKGLIEPPFRVLARSANTQGKSFIAALAVNWWFDTRSPSIGITTAPTQAQVEEILWGEVRMMRTKAGLGGLRSAVAPRLYDSPDHWARGYTANTGTSFHGRHNECVLIVVDEALGVGPEFFPAAESMLNGKEYAMLLLYNPTDGTSHIRRMEDNEKQNKVVVLNAFEHPNVQAELRNEPAPFPAAVHLQWVEDFIAQYSDPVEEGSERPRSDGGTDIQIGQRLVNGEWTAGKWYRPSGEAESRVLGQWPTQSEQSVWSETAWRHVSKPEFRLKPSSHQLQVGVDVALDGPDKSAFAVRQAGVLRYVQAFQGLKPHETHQKARELAWHYAREIGVDPKTVPIVVDDFGCGSKVMACDSDGYQFIGIGGNELAADAYLYPNKRSELGFALADAARDQEVWFDVGVSMLDELKRQFLSMRYECRGTKRVLREKKEQKKLLGHSPDEADAIMLAYANVTDLIAERVVGHVR